jgi:S1-C subfamily serine protease
MGRSGIGKVIAIGVVAAALFAAGAAAARAGSIKRPPAAPGAAPVDRDPLPDFGLGIDGEFNGRGIRITRAPSGGHAAQVGIERGDVLLAINGSPVRTPEDWVRMMTDNNGRFNIRLRDVRTGGITYRDVDLRK